VRIHRRSSLQDCELSEGSESRGRRGWGPFTGGQLTAIILGITLAVAFPLGAWAVTGSNVFVADSVSGKTASVNALRQLSVNAAGVVTANPAPPSAMYVGYMNANDPHETACFFPPAGKALVVTEVDLELPYGTTPAQVYLNAGATTKTSTQDCGYVGVEAVGVRFFASHETQDVTFPSGLPIKNGHAFIVANDTAWSDQYLNATVKGFLVPATQCTSTTCY